MERETKRMEEDRLRGGGESKREEKRVEKRGTGTGTGRERDRKRM